MPSLLPLVEGPGDKSAVPALLRRLLVEGGHYEWRVDGRVKQVHSLPSFRKRLSDFLGYLRKEAPDAVLVLLDLDDGCPAEEAKALAAQVRGESLPFPIAVVFAHREYEAWFLAGIEAFPSGLRYEEEPEEKRDAKGWVTVQMPEGVRYKETTDQERFTHLLDLAAARARSRSFRRLCKAVDELVQHAGQPVVTP